MGLSADAYYVVCSNDVLNITLLGFIGQYVVVSKVAINTLLLLLLLLLCILSLVQQYMHTTSDR